jgi:hypothetical protein
VIGIYKITSPVHKIYIGQSIDIERRFREYQIYQQSISIGRKLYNSLQKYNPFNHYFEVIEECTLLYLNEREIYWGLKFDVLGKNGLNLRLGEANGLCSEETKQKIGQGNKGKAKPNAGPKKQPIIQYNLEGNFIREWSSAKEAAVFLNKSSSAITECCKQIYNRKSAYGYIWKLKE